MILVAVNLLYRCINFLYVMKSFWTMIIGQKVFFPLLSVIGKDVKHFWITGRDVGIVRLIGPLIFLIIKMYVLILGIGIWTKYWMVT